MNCEFYLFRPSGATPYKNNKFTTTIGDILEIVAADNWIGVGLTAISTLPKTTRLVQLPYGLAFEKAELLEFDEAEKLIAVTELTPFGFSILNNHAFYIAINFKGADFEALEKSLMYFVGYKATPHYKELSLKYSKETNQMFFRKTIDGKVTLHGFDFNFVASSNLEDRLLFNAYRFGKLLTMNWFSKSDCKIDYAKHSLELKFYPEDGYTSILNAYENTYDLIKEAPAITPLYLTKRAAYQIYQPGSNTITSYFAGTYVENEVLEVVDSEKALKNDFYFTKQLDFTEVTLSGFSTADLNTTFIITKTSQKWYGQKGDGAHSLIWLEKVASKGLKRAIPSTEESPESQIAYGPRLSDSKEIPLEKIEGLHYVTLYDSYRIHISAADGLYDVYQSKYLYADTNDGTNFSLSGGEEKAYEMVTPVSNISPQSFYLGDYMYTRSIWARCLADVSSYTTAEGQIIDLYDLPANDFAITRGNYKKCIGVESLVLWQSDYVQKEPTKFGIDDFGNYFTSNFIPAQLSTERPLPVARSNWGNTSTWVTEDINYKSFEHQMRKTFVLKDAYSIGSAIKAILRKIDKNVSFDETPEYSSFLYGSLSDKYRMPLGFGLYITPKSNVLKSGYDQAARKADITFKDLMDLLRDGFRCFWFIDSENRLRIEHISFFYTQPSKLDLTEKFDKFNKKAVIFGQKEITYDKKDLPARYEFNWMDDCTDLFGNMSINVESNYVQKDKVESVTLNKFSADLDLMMLQPDNFSNDGFALIIADTTSKKVPILLKDNLKDDEFRYPYDAEIQNYYASWLHLVNYYMRDMPSNKISYTSLADGSLQVEQLKRSMTTEVTCPKGFDIEVGTTVATTFGAGIIENLEVNMDTELASITLSYEPN